MRYPRNPLDVLAQQIVAMVRAGHRARSTRSRRWSAARRRSPALPRSALEAVLDMLAGRYPSDAFAELRPRIVWDRVTGELTGRPGAQRLAVTSGGTIPDRGLFGVFLAGDDGPGRRVGELDEEMVYESRVGDVFLLGLVVLADRGHHPRPGAGHARRPGEAGKMPFWKGDAPGRPVELGRALGAFLRELSRLDDRGGHARAPRPPGSTSGAPTNLLAYLAEQREATGAPARRPDASWSSGSATSSATGGW